MIFKVQILDLEGINKFSRMKASSLFCLLLTFFLIFLHGKH